MDDHSGTFEVLEQRKFTARLSLMIAIVGATAALILILVDSKSPIFFGKGSDMGPILIASGAFIVVAAIALLIPKLTEGISEQGRVIAYVLAGLLEVAVVLGGISLFG